MNPKIIILFFICIFIAFHLRLEWLGILLVAALVFVTLSSIKREHAVIAPVPRGEATTLYPVIYEDVGEPPYLWAPGQTKLVINPDYRPIEWFAKPAWAAGNIVASARALLGRGPKEKD